MHLTPHWHDIQHMYPEAHIALQRIAAMLYERMEEVVPRSSAGDIDLQPALELGFVTINADKITFSDPEVHQDYLLSHPPCRKAGIDHMG